MTRCVITAEPDTPVAEIARRLIANQISAVPVVDGAGRLVGIVSEGDLMRRPETETERHPSWWLTLLAPEKAAMNYVKAYGHHAKDVMTHQVTTVSEDASLEEIAEILEKQHIKRVPVVTDGKLVGIVSRANLLHGLIARGSGDSPSNDDWEIKTLVENNLSVAGVRAQLLNVVVSGGVVHLWGVVATTEEQAAARVAAESVPGMTALRFNVEVIPPYMRPFIRAG